MTVASLTAAQARTIERVLAAGGPVPVGQGRLDRRSVNLACCKRMLAAGLLEGSIPLDRRRTQLYCTTAGVLALRAYELAQLGVEPCCVFCHPNLFGQLRQAGQTAPPCNKACRCHRPRQKDMP